MCDDSDQEISELDIQSRTWKKLENDMKLLGFREGAAQGRYLSLQEGFNLGYSDGFKLGEYIGMCKGIIRCESEMDVIKSNFDENALDSMSREACVICSQEKKSSSTFTQKIPSVENIEDLISTQQSHSDEIMNNLKQSGLKYFNKSNAMEPVSNEET